MRRTAFPCPNQFVLDGVRGLSAAAAEGLKILESGSAALLVDARDESGMKVTGRVLRAVTALGRSIGWTADGESEHRSHELARSLPKYFDPVWRLVQLPWDLGSECVDSQGVC